MPRRDFYEIKIRKVGDRRRWEDIPPGASHRPLTAEEAAAAANMVANAADVAEVRMNKAGSLQGDYIPGPSRAREVHRWLLENE